MVNGSNEKRSDVINRGDFLTSTKSLWTGILISTNAIESHLLISFTVSFIIIAHSQSFAAILLLLNSKENLFNNLLEYSKKFPIHPEQFIYEYLVNKYNIDIVYIPFVFDRVRASGYIYNDSNDKSGYMVEYTLEQN